MNRIEFINKLEGDLAVLNKADRAFQVEVCNMGLDCVGDDVWLRGAEISRAIISVRNKLAVCKLEVGKYPIHMDIPSNIGGSHQ